MPRAQTLPARPLPWWQTAPPPFPPAPSANPKCTPLPPTPPTPGPWPWPPTRACCCWRPRAAPRPPRRQSQGCRPCSGRPQAQAVHLQSSTAAPCGWPTLRRGGGRRGGGARALTADLRARGAAARLPDAAPPTCPRLLASDCGRYVAAVWRRGGGTAGGVFAVWERPGDGLATRASGGGGRLRPRPRPRIRRPRLDVRGGRHRHRCGLGGGRAPAGGAGARGAREHERGRQARRDRPCLPARPRPPHHRLCRVRGGGRPRHPGRGRRAGGGGGATPPPPTRVHGGAALAVARADGRTTLHPWNTPSTASPPLPSPVALAWAPRATGVALAYPSRVDMCAARGGGAMITRAASLPVRRVVGAAWDGARLVLLTPDAVHVAVVGGLGGEAPPSIDVSVIAAATPPRPLTDAPSPTPLPSLPPVQRSPGPLALVAVSESAVWVVDAAGRPHPLPLASPASRARARWPPRATSAPPPPSRRGGCPVQRTRMRPPSLRRWRGRRVRLPALAWRACRRARGLHCCAPRATLPAQWPPWRTRRE